MIAATPPDWVFKLLGLDPQRLKGGSEHFRFARFPEGAMGLVLFVLLLSGFAVILAIYRREGQLPRPRKLLLAGLRCALLAGVALVLLYPVLEVDRVEELRATTIVLVDDSLSQGIRDRYQGDPERRDALAKALDMKPEEVAASSRSELVTRALWRRESRILERLEERNRVVAYSFAGLPLRPLKTRREEKEDQEEDRNHSGPPAALAAPGQDPEAAGRPSPACASITDIAGALRLAVEEQAGARIAAIVLLSDGRVTAGEDLSGAGAILRDKGIPVHAAGAGDPTPTRNLRVTSLLASERVFSGDPVALDARVEGTGFDGEAVELELLDAYEPPGEAPRAPARIEAAEVILPGAENDSGASAARGKGIGAAREAVHSFRFEPKGVGRHRLTVRIAPRPEEALAEDNERTAAVEVVKEASKVLLIAGAPTYEYRFLKNLLRRDARISLAAWLMSADPDYPQEGNVSLKKLPDSAKELFEYDVVLLLDIAPRGLPPNYPQLIEDFVAKHRGGLLYLAGDKYGASFFDADEMLPIRNMLPVSADAAAVKDEVGPGRFYERQWPMEPTAAALDHPATRLSSQIDKNRELWAEIAGFFWSFPARKAKPGATVLFVHPDPALARDGGPRPLMASQMYGGGRVIWCGIDSTWRWRATAEEVYDRFWVQTVRYLTESRLLGARRRLVETDREAYELGDTVRVSVLMEDENYQPLERDEQPLLVDGPDSSIQELRLAKDAAAPGWYRGVFAPRLLGAHKLRLEEGEEKTFTVEPPALEFQDPRLDEAALRALAEITHGSYEPLANLSAIPERISDRRHAVVTTDEPIPLWDNAFSLSLLAGLLTLEWILRKVNRLL